MRLLISTVILVALGTPAMAADCPTGSIEKALNAPLDGLKKTERTVSDIQSTEGGVWRIYRKKDGKLGTLMRVDGGESGMGERRLSVVSPDAYGITVTRVDYLRHAFIDEAGPNGTAKRTTEYFYYCGGKLYVPPSQFATLDEGAYRKGGAEAQRVMLGDKDVADVTRGLKQ